VVIVDTSVWVNALRLAGSPEQREVARLVAADEAAIVGMILVELLRGARSQQDFDALRDRLLGADLLDTAETTWLRASQVLLDLRLQGDTIPLADAVVAAHALEGNHAIYTTDRHFERVPGLSLHVV
jgi:predicted nucleic acid-binding protein